MMSIFLFLILWTSLYTTSAFAQVTEACYDEPQHKISTGGNHTIIVKDDGSVWTWGLGDRGQLGHGSDFPVVDYISHLENADKNIPTRVEALVGKNIIAVAAGGNMGSDRSFAIESDGTAWGWGANGNGMLGIGEPSGIFSLPVPVDLTNVRAIAIGAWHTVALKNDGTVWSWGYGRHGNGSSVTEEITPVQVENLNNVIAVDAGDAHTIILKNDGTVWTWGYGGHGALGHGDAADQLTPVQVQNLDGITAIAAGSYFNVALKSDGTVWTWGWNDRGQLGNGEYGYFDKIQYSPVQVPNINDVVGVTAGHAYTLVIKYDGTVWAWGDNQAGQLGDGTTSYNQTTPVQSQNLNGAIAIAAGMGHTIALKDDCTLWGWGSNWYGQLGNGTTESFVLTPEQLTSFYLCNPDQAPDESCSGVEVCDGGDNDNDGFIDEDFPSGNTSCGGNVNVSPDGVTFTFSSVTLSGDTTVTTSGTGAPLPSGFKLGATPTYYEIASTAAFNGTVEVCINYDETQFATERSLKLFHWEASWKDITTSLDTTANVICGNTTSFSPFIVAESSASPTAITLQNFSAYLDGGHVVLTWSTAFEMDNEGFHIQRAESPSGPFVEITPSMIPAMDGPGMKETYTFTNSGVESGKTYYYRLQDIDSRGRITAHGIIPVSVGVAERETPSSSDGVSQKKGEEDTGQAVGQGGGDSDLRADPVQSRQPASWTSVAVIDTMRGGSASERDSLAASEGDKAQQPEPAYSDKQKMLPTTTAGPYVIDESATSNTSVHQTIETQHTSTGPSSFSVSIEDKDGNIIEIKRVEASPHIVEKSTTLQVTWDDGRAVLRWQASRPVKGYLLYRSEKGKDNYIQVSGVIPYFGPYLGPYLGKDEKEHYHYKFIDNRTKPGISYDYRLEAIEPVQKVDLKIGKIESP